MEAEIKEETTQPVRLEKGGVLMELLDAIIGKEKKRGHKKVSYATAGEIFGKRVIAAGGLKD